MLPCGALPAGALAGLLGAFGLRVGRVADDAAIPGTYWGEPEAGIVGETVWIRDDTPVHSALHEACHVICMDASRRARLHTDAGGDVDEENGVNYLAIVLADQLRGFGAARLLQDMDAWGYTFRLGSAAAWFAEDAEDARRWLLDHGLIDTRGRPTLRRREDAGNPG
ncbi:MAG: hypothetical protein H6983_16680 [Ectothiorhodospiraceae bacterium]|nr:hypothetical protein [Ectothiorhodospiraceae bacterium]